MSTLSELGTSVRQTRERARFARAALSTMPIVIASSLAMTMNMSGPIALHEQGTDLDDRVSPTVRDNVRAAFQAAAAATGGSEAATPEADFAVAVAPANYTVQSGDSISGIAGRFGLSTASVLAMNGLGWKSVIHPGQILVLSKKATPAPVASAPTASDYTIASGDTISSVASKFGLSTASLLAANGLTQTSVIYPGQRIVLRGSNSPAPTASSSHTIVAGETVTSVAAQHGVSVADLLAANNLQAESTIFAGATLTLPSARPAAATVAAVPTSAEQVVPLTPEMRSNARTIVAVGRSLGVSDYGLVVALATAAQESTLRNLDWGDLDSVGLFQQRPSAGWGTASQLTTPEHAARLFFGGPRNPNAENTRGLLDIPGWEAMTVTQAAQAVQISAFPDAYAKWESSARAWLAQIG